MAEADVVIPSLDAADEKTFRRINRPHRELKIEEIIDGMIEFGRGYGGKLYIEVMLVKGYNDSEEALFAIKSALERIKPDGV